MSQLGDLVEPLKAKLSTYLNFAIRVAAAMSAAVRWMLPLKSALRQYCFGGCGPKMLRLSINYMV